MTQSCPIMGLSAHMNSASFVNKIIVIREDERSVSTKKSAVTIRSWLGGENGVRCALIGPFGNLHPTTST